MKRFNRVFCAALAAAVMFVSLSFGSFAADAGYSMTPEQWTAYWDTVKDSNTLVALMPGADESRMNFCWHSGIFEGKPCVKISKSADMSAAQIFYGTVDTAENLKQRVNRVSAYGLKENTVYYYIYSSGKGFSEPVSFTTRDADDFKLMYVSDIQCSGDTAANAAATSEAWQNTLSSALDAHGDIGFVVAAGDNANSGIAQEWTATLSPPALRSLPLATCVGNHDMKTLIYSRYVNNPNTFPGCTPNPTGNGYWFTYGDVLFISYNANKKNIADQYALTKAAVNANPDAKWRVAIMHHDIYGTGGHCDNNHNKENYLMQAAYGALYDDYRIDLVLTGHDHIYGRSYYMYAGKPVANEGYAQGSVTNPEGTVYFTASAAAGKSRVEEKPYSYSWLAFSYPYTNIPIYSIIEFTNSECLIESYISDSGEQIDTFKITKTQDRYEGCEPLGVFAYIAEVLKKIDFNAFLFGKLPA